MWIRYSKHKKNLSDEQLIRRYKKSDDLDILAQLYDRYIELVYGVSLKYLEDEGQCKDAVIEIYERLIRSVKRHDINNFESWLHVVTKNYCLEQLRKKGRKPTVLIDHESVQSLEIAHHDKEFDIVQGNSELTHCMQQLTVRQKKCITQFYYEEKSYKDIALELELTTGNVRSHIQNGRNKLKHCLEKKHKHNVEQE